ncbi:hypothetical protein M2138_000462 [Dysgonomonadaceae bacterium PH5-43]|nr:hypothetical protein [Dysgonomonadaceae bacterium PH5-43]
MISNDYSKYNIVQGLIIICLLLLCLNTKAQSKADSIIIKHLEHRDEYSKYIDEYDAQIYIKGNIEVLKKNIMFEFAPDFFYLNKDNDSSFVEAIVDIKYTAPNYFNQEIVALNGYRFNAKDILDRIIPFLNVNIYKQTIFDDQIVIPDRNNIFKYYEFEYINNEELSGYKVHKIQITPKIKSQKLVSGYFYIIDELWTIHKFDLKGRTELSDYRVVTEFGFPLNNFLLPINSTISFNLDLLGNNINTSYYAFFNYASYKLHDTSNDKKVASYDLSKYFTTNNDSILIIRDSSFWKNTRPIPLSDYEETLYETQLRIEKESNSKPKLNRKIRNVSKGIFTPYKKQFGETQLVYSGLLNPLTLSYSKMEGIVYWQQLRLSKGFNNGQTINYNFDVGYSLTKNEIYFDVPISWTFAPSKMGRAHLDFRNSNQTFNSNVIKKIEDMVPDSINLKDFNIDYFKNYNLEIKAQYELTNGLLLEGGVDYNWYVPIEKQTQIDNDNLQDLVEDNYLGFSPIVGLKWTPGQYYRFNGKRKEYLRSRFPTFSIEYARGIKGVFGSNSNYERIELDIQQKISWGLMQSFHYYIGAGWFTNSESVYFANFKNFRRRNIPQSWNDPLGGVFHLLDGDWYNASNSYYQAHIMYESPFALLQLFNGLTNDILQERIYISHLYMPALPSYSELGYSIGNFFGNAGIFFSFNKARLNSIGLKVAFELR